jgi:hypothetical protein
MTSEERAEIKRLAAEIALESDMDRFNDLALQVFKLLSAFPGIAGAKSSHNARAPLKERPPLD